MELRVDGWSVGARFSASHYIPQHEKCGRLHGHTYAVSCVFRGDVVEGEDMMVDFIAVKEALRDICDELDHHVLVPTESPHTEIEEAGEEVFVRTKGKRYVFPREDVKFLPIRSATAERLAEWFADTLLDRLELPPTVVHVDLGIEEGKGQGAWAHRDL